MLTLGIDLGGKFIGVAVVEQDTNEVQYAATIKLNDSIKDLYDTRRTLRRYCRNQVRYRKPDESVQGGCFPLGTSRRVSLSAH